MVSSFSMNTNELKQSMSKGIFLDLPQEVLDAVIFSDEGVSDEVLQRWVLDNEEEFKDRIVCLLHSKGCELPVAEWGDLEDENLSSWQVCSGHFKDGNYKEFFSGITSDQLVRIFLRLISRRAEDFIVSKSDLGDREAILDEHFEWERERLRESLDAIRERIAELLKSTAEKVWVAEQIKLHPYGARAVHSPVKGEEGVVMRRLRTKVRPRFNSSFGGPNIVTSIIFDTGIITEDMTGVPTLWECLKDENISLKEALRLLLDGAEGCAFLHKGEVVCNDFKPENILNCGGVGKLGDLEMAAPLNIPFYGGTPRYMPERYYCPGISLPRAVSAIRTDFSRDVFAFGAALLKVYQYCMIGTGDVLGRFMNEINKLVRENVNEKLYDRLREDKGFMAEAEAIFERAGKLKERPMDKIRAVFRPVEGDDRDFLTRVKAVSERMGAADLKDLKKAMELVMMSDEWSDERFMSQLASYISEDRKILEDFVKLVIDYYNRVSVEMIDYDQVEDVWNESRRQMSGNQIPVRMWELIRCMMDRRSEMRPSMGEAIRGVREVIG